MLQEYQKEIIKKKLELNFDEELIKSKKNEKRKVFHKSFRNELDILIHQFYKDGIQFYGFTIDLLYLKEIEKESIWQNVHEDVENWINDSGLNIELIEFCYISIELNQAKRIIAQKNDKSIAHYSIVGLNNLPHLHGVLGVRTIMGHNDALDISIKKQFRGCQDWEDIKIDRLYTIKSIKSYWNYVIKENNFKFHRFARYGEHLKYLDIYGTIADNEMIYDEPQRCAFNLCMHKNSNTYNINGVQTRNPSSKTLVIYLLNLFLFYKNYKINKNKIYQKTPNTKYSWMILDSLEYLKKNNIKIFECLKKIYPQQLEEINTMEIITNNWNQTMDDILENNHYLLSVKFRKDAIEFTDGIYFTYENKFYSFKDNELNIKMKMKNQNCCIYFAKNYHYLIKPKLWLAKFIDIFIAKLYNCF